VHDLRGLLSVIATVTTVLQRPSSRDRLETLLVVLHRNVSGLCGLLDGVADLARLDTTQEQAVLCRVDIASVLSGLSGGFRELATSRGLQLQTQGPRELLADSDALMLTRVVQNLMLNAISYTEARGVALRWGTAAGGRWYVEIGDVPGIEPGAGELQPLAAHVPGAGEGIGLAIVERLCGVLGGRMQIVCTGGLRSTRIELPRRYAGSLQTLTMSFTEPGRCAGRAARVSDAFEVTTARRAS
jgi:signal transduction histidine kinase